MTEHWRLLIHGSNTASTNMAIDRAILEAHRQGHVPPTIRFYSWSPPAVSIGYFQSLTAEVDIEEDGPMLEDDAVFAGLGIA